MMVSELADAILKRVSPIGNDLSNGELTSAIDAGLQEVRDVLDGLIVRRWKSNEPIQCWCDAIGDDEHRATCQRARALMEKLTCRWLTLMKTNARCC